MDVSQLAVVEAFDNIQSSHSFMLTRMVHLSRMLAVFVIVSIAAIGCKRVVPPPPATQAATKPATLPATKPATTQYTDVIRAHYPKFPATQPLDIPVDLRDAGHYVLSEPVYL